MRYGALLPPFARHLLVGDTARSAACYCDVLDGEVHDQHLDIAGVRVAAVAVMLHADHAGDEHPWYAALAGAASAAWKRGRGWREALVRDPDGYEWAVEVLAELARGLFGPQRARSRGAHGV